LGKIVSRSLNSKWIQPAVECPHRVLTTEVEQHLRGGDEQRSVAGEQRRVDECSGRSSSCRARRRDEDDVARARVFHGLLGDRHHGRTLVMPGVRSSSRLAARRRCHVAATRDEINEDKPG